MLFLVEECQELNYCIIIDMESIIQVPTVNERKRIPDQVIQEIIRRIAERFSPKKILLFGSYASNQPKPESDLDLLIVLDTSIREIQQALEIRQYINVDFGLDLIVITPDHLARRLELGDFFLSEIIEKGKVLYESIDT